MNRLVQVIRPGLVSYREGLELQQQARLRVAGGEIAGVLILLEHQPVITTGRGGGRENLRASLTGLQTERIEIVEADRGGNITCHNPGQLVGYPVLNLSHWQEDVHWYVEQLEEVLIRTAGCYGVVAGRKARYTGVWVGNRKLAAIGVSVRRWITGHGFALNVNNDLSLFQQIVPCGIEEFGVTSLRNVGVMDRVTEVADQLLAEFATVFAAELQQPEEA
jgi:lipoyl(octanoyl) transferase